MDSLLNRRRMLTIGGAAVVLTPPLLALLSHSALGAADPGHDGAYAPWALLHDPALRGSPLALVAAAALAANPHDTQPWLFKAGTDRIEVYADPRRRLGAMDPFLREMHLGLGCAIENAVIAAGAHGFATEVSLAAGTLALSGTDLAPRKVATITLRPSAGAASDPLYRAIPLRHTNRHPYRRARPLPTALLGHLAGLTAGDDERLVLIEPAQRPAFDSMVVSATEAIIADAAMIADSDRWFRATPAEIEQHRDGPTLETAGLSPWLLAMAHMAGVSPAASHKGWLDNTRDHQLPSAPATGLIVVRQRFDTATCLAAGRMWQRAHLVATACGAAMQPLNQPIELVDRDLQLGRPSPWAARLAAFVGPQWQATFAFRAGMPAQSAPPSPRRRLQDILVA